jgi:hypothetical protein
LAAAPKAFGVDALYKEAGGTAGGVELDLEAKKRDLYRELGTQVLPTYVAALSKLVSGLRYLNGFAESHPRLARALMLTATGFGVVMTAAGGVLVALGALVGQLALVRLAFQAAGIKLGSLFGTAAAAGGEAVEKASLLSRVFTIARTAIAGLAGASMATVGIVAGVLAVVVGVVLVIRKYWGPIVAWFQGVGQGIAQGITPAFNEVREALGPLGAAFGTLAEWAGMAWRWFLKLIEPVQATTEQLDGARASGASFGHVIGEALGGIIKGVTYGVRAFVWLGEALGTAAGFVVISWDPVASFFVGLWDGVKSAASTALDWITEKIDAVRQVIERLQAMWARIRGEMPASATPIEWIMPEDHERAMRVRDAIARGPEAVAPTQAPIVAQTAASAPAPRVYNVTVNANGLDEHAARRVAVGAIDDHERKQASRKRSAYADQD